MVIPEGSNHGTQASNPDSMAAYSSELRPHGTAGDRERFVGYNRAYDRVRVQKQVEWLGELAKIMRGLPGRKQIVFLSEGFDGSLIQGSDGEQAKSNSDAIMHGDIATIESDSVFGSSTQLTNLRGLEQAFRGSDVVLNTIDVRGIRGMTGETASISDSKDGLFLLAGPTGGIVIHNSNNLNDDFQRYLHRQEVVYILGFYAPPPTKAGACHPIKVKVTGAAGRVTVANGSGYYDGGATDFNERLLATSDIVMNDIAQKDVRISALAAAFPAAGGN